MVNWFATDWGVSPSRTTILSDLYGPRFTSMNSKGCRCSFFFVFCVKALLGCFSCPKFRFWISLSCCSRLSDVATSLLVLCSLLLGCLPCSWFSLSARLSACLAFVLLLVLWVGCTCIENSLQWAYVCRLKFCDGLGEFSETVIEIGGD